VAEQIKDFFLVSTNKWTKSTQPKYKGIRQKEKEINSKQENRCKKKKINKIKSEITKNTYYPK
jgi:hypothetical protein